MKRDQYKTVTGFVFLTSAKKEEAMGEPTFEPELFWNGGDEGPDDDPAWVRIITLPEIKKMARELKGESAVLFDALLAFRDALESSDELALEQAKERMEKVYRMREEKLRFALESHLSIEEEKLGYPLERIPLDRIWKHTFWRGTFREVAPRWGMTPNNVFRAMYGLQPGPKAKENPAILLSYEVSKAVSVVRGAFDLVADLISGDVPDMERPRIVLWWFEGAFRPAIYCESPEVALFLHTFFLAPSGVPSFRRCPKCGEQFFQDRPNQEYCSPEHREAHRVARFRNRKRRDGTDSGKDEKGHGSKKAR